MVRSTKYTAFCMGVQRVAIFLALACGFWFQSALADPEATVSLDVADTNPFIGEGFSFDAVFDNTGPAGDTGFGPFIDLIIPSRGVDGDPGIGEPLDGIDFVSASFAGFPIDFFTLTFPDADGAGAGITGCVEHPLAVDTSGDPLEVCGLAGDTLVVARLPFGSFVTDQPPARITIDAQVSNLADVGASVAITARGGFQFGADELDNPSTDPSILSQASTDSTTWAPNQDVTPQIVTVEKTAPEGLTGENYPRQYQIEVEIAPGQTIDDLVISDLLPSDVVYLGATPSQGSVTVEPVLGEVVDPLANEVRIELAGGASGIVTLAIDFYVPEADFSLTPTIPRDTADGQTSDPNEVTVTGDWANPIDTRDTGGPFSIDVNNVVRQDIALDLDKTIDTGSALPGEVVEYTLQIRPSDYFAFDQLNIDDVLADGHRWFTDVTRVPTLALSGHQGSLPAAEIDASNIAITPNYSAFGDDATGDGNTGDGTDGTTLIEFAVSDELIRRGQSGQLLGGCFPNGTGGNGVADCDRAGNAQLQSPDAVSVITITFYAEVQQFFSDDLPSGNRAVVQGDNIGNTASVDARVLQDDTLAPTGFQEASGDGAGFNIPVGALSKELYRINDAPPPSPATMRPGDAVTYRITYNLPTHNFEQFRLIDYLPLPVFSATTVNTFQDEVSAASPAVGVAKFGPADTLRDFLNSNGLNLPINGGRVPVLTSDASGNLIQFNYGDFDTDGGIPDAPETVDILFTVEVSDAPFANGLLLTNQAQALESTTSQEASTSDAINQITLNEPELVITKGIESSSNPSASIDPDPVGDPVDNNLLDADAGDVVRFVITLDNEGDASAFDVNVWDSAPAELTACSINAVTIDGVGATFSGDLFDVANPLILDDAIPEGQRALIEYDCTLAAGVAPRQLIDNLATANWTAAAGASQAFADISDDAEITVADPELSKTAVAVNPGPAGSDVVPGDVITYQLTVTLPEGNIPGVTIEDALPSGFSYVGGSVAINSAGFTGTISNDPPTVGGSAQTPLFSFGDITATGTAGTSENGFLLTYDVLVLDDVANAALNSPQNKTNTATLDYSGNPGGGISDNHTVQFREPELTLGKSVNPSTGLQGGDTVTVTLTLENTGTADALDITVSDVLDNTVFNTATVTNLSTPAGFTNTASGATNSWDSTAALAAGASQVFSFDVELQDDVLTGSTFTNTADVVGFSQLSGVPERRQTDDNGSDDLSTTAVATSKTLIDDSEPSTANPAESVIGEVVRFQLAFTMPTGITLDGSGGDNAIIRDILPTGLAYQTGTATIQSTAASDPVLSGSVSGNIATTETAISPTIAGNELRFNLGDITNTGDGSEQIVIRFDALVQNIAGNDLGVVRTNRGRLRYRDSDGSNIDIDDTQNLRILEPQFSTFTKTAAPATGQAGDTIDYEVVFQASNAADTATAFDVVVSDQLPADMSLDVSSISAMFAPAACSAISADNSDGPTRLVELEFAGIPQGCEVTVSYQADLLVGVSPGDVLTNDADLVWTSVPGSNGTGAGTPGAPGDPDGERTGSGGVNDYASSTTADVEIEPGELAKVVFDSSNAFTVDGQLRAGVDDLAIGETATFNITATIPFGTTTPVVINDTLPYTNGVMAYQSAQLISVGDNLVADNNPPTITVSDAQLGDGINDTVSFDFGEVVNDPATFDEDTDPQSDIQIVVEVVGLILDLSANANSDELTNTALLSFGGLDASANAEVDVVEPSLTLDKTGDINTGQGGDVVTFTLTLGHDGTSNADAHDAVLIDNLPTGMQLVPDSLSQTSGPPAGTLSETANGIDVRWDRLALGQTAVVSFQAALTIDVVSGETVTNTSDLDWTSMPGSPVEERSYATDANHGVMITEPGVTKVVASSSNADTASDQFGAGVPDLTIGEEVTYTVTVELPKGTSRNVQVVDTLPGGSVAFEIVSSELVTVGVNIAGVSAGLAGTANVDNDEVSWNLGDLTNDPAGAPGPDDLLTFEVVAVVMDDPLNQSGAVNQLNTATLTTDSTGPGSATAPVDVVAPTIEVSKEVINPADGFVEGDEVVDYTLTVRHTGVSTAPGYNLEITDTLPTDLAWEGDGTVSSTCPGFSFDSSADPDVVFEVNRLLLDDGPATDGECTISFQGRTAVDVQPNQSLLNMVALDYDSMPNNDSGQNRTRSDSDTAGVTVNAPGITKEVVSTTLADTGMGQHDPTLTDLAIGEEVSYQITVTFPEGVTNDALIVDMLPVDGSNNTRLEAVGASVVSLGARISTSLTGAPLFSDASGDGVDDTVNFDFGSVTNNPDGVTDAGDRIVVQVTARLTDIASNVDAELLVNEATFSFDGGAASDTADVEIVEPDLAVSKAMALAGNGEITITLGVTNTGTAPAFAINVSDVLDEAVWDLSSLAFGSVSSGYELVSEAGPGAGESTVRLRSVGATALPAGGSISGQFSLALAVLPPVDNPLPNQADLTEACSLPGDCAAGPGREQTPDNDVDNIAVPDLSVDKTAALQVDADGSTDVSPGDTLRYTLTIRNDGAAAATNLLLVDTPDMHTALVNGSVTASSGTVLEGNTAGDNVIRVSVASLAAASDVTINYDVVIDNPLPAGVEEAVNQALLSSDELPPVVSDDPDPPGDDDETIVPINAAPDLLVIKDDGGVTAVPGGSIVYTLDYENVGNQDATGVVLTDTVPVNTRFNAALSDAGWSCLPDVNAGSTCSLNIGDLDAGDVGLASFVLDLDNPLSDGVTQIINTAVIADDGSNGPDPTLDNNSDDETTPVDAAPDLAIVKSDGDINAEPGGVVVYTLDYVNNGDQEATGIEITETVPPNTTFLASASMSGWICTPDGSAGNTCVLDIGLLAGGASGSALFAIALDDPVPLTYEQIPNNVSIADDGTNGPDPTPDDNVSSTLTPVLLEPALELVKVLSDAPDPIMLGSLLEFTIVATNSGNVTLSNVLVTDSLVTPIGGTTPCASVAPGGICTLVGTYEVTQLDVDNGRVFNTAGVDSDQTDPIETSLLTPVPQNPAIDLVKEAVLNDINSNGLGDDGEVIDYTITATNTGDVTLSNVEIVDSLLEDLVCAPSNPMPLLAPGASFECTGSLEIEFFHLTGGPIVNIASVLGFRPDNEPVEAADDVATPVNPPLAVPMLDRWSLLLLALLMLGGAGLVVRRYGAAA